MFKIYQLSFVLLLIVHPIQAKNLLELYQLAEDSDPQLKIANQERLITFEKKAQAQAPLLPEISLGANANENWNTQHWMSGHNVENTHIGYNISLRYTLYRREFNIQLEQVDSQINQVNALYEVAKQELIERLSTRYFAILSAQDTLKFERIAKRAFKRQLEEAQQRFQVGLIAITDVEEAQAGYDLAIADEIQAKNDLDNAHEGLRELTGTYHQILATLKTEVPLLEPDPANIDAWTQTALEHNPKLLAAQYAIENARLDIGKQRAAHLPTIDLVAQHSYNHNLRGDDTGALTNNNSIGIQLNYYLYEGGAIRARTRESQQYRIKA
ncbi:MAG: TolC family protein, partial [Thiomargarita sp.]|nr:TolC family protein [Thiomargarita sp.]